MNLSLLLGSAITTGGLMLVFSAFRARLRRSALLRDCIRVKGKVVRLEDTRTEGDLVATWAPVVTYRAQGNHELKLPPMSDTRPYSVGTSVPVFYQRDDPGNAVHVRRIWDVNLACVLSFLPLLFGLGILFTCYQDAAR